MPRTSLLFGIGLSLSLLMACKATNPTNNSSGGGGSSNTAGSGQGGDDGNQFGGFGGMGNTNNTNTIECKTDKTLDDDGDGFSEDQGDCNDCDKNSNPGAVEVINTEPDMNGNIPPTADEDCDGTADNVVESCDDGIALTDPDPFSGAKAIDLCQQSNGSKWGVLESAYVRADGSTASPPDSKQWGIKTEFGQNVAPQRGKSLLVLSAGHARGPNDPDACASNTCTPGSAGNAPAGFPQDVPGCAGDTEINDDVGLQLKLRAPTNATGYSFNFKFYSFEFPEYVCTNFNDQFIALVQPPPMGSINGNISFDKNTNPVSVNIAFFDVCDPASVTNWAQVCAFDFTANCPPAPNPYCPSGVGELQGNGFFEWDQFGYAGGTSWLKTQAPVTPGQEVTIRFAIWDTGDQALDSTALIDNFQWIATGGTVNVGTEEIPDPK